ncbi:nucleotidyltransferase domain-containing protein [Methanohalobium sp.]|uniref:nucleotidyltransferase domain-containing protein n=1 Tax=Methanohalobium sp. TaxID=2837493 RepID=UPI0025E2A2C5|nr:nucleotidyltransferase domain-containing protein [Methanohalobium sp.]
MVKTRLRDFIVTEDDWIFAVADYFHPNGIRSILRYVPDKNGDRELNGIRYRKYDFNDAFKFMRENRPSWVNDVHIVPKNKLKKVLYPDERIPELVKTNKKVASIVETLDEAGIPRDKMGVTGSLLPGLQKDESDIDFIVYGSSWFDARDAIYQAKSKGGSIEEISEDMWLKIYNKRVPDIPFDEFKLHEKRKGNRGMVDGTYFDLLFVRDWSQIYQPLQRGEDTKRMKIEAPVTNSEFAFDNPAVFEIDHETIDHVFSYTHTYAGQVVEGEIMEAQGIVEDLGDTKRLVIGTSREPKGEWIRSLTLLEKNGYI